MVEDDDLGVGQRSVYVGGVDGEARDAAEVPPPRLRLRKMYNLYPVPASRQQLWRALVQRAMCVFTEDVRKAAK